MWQIAAVRAPGACNWHSKSANSQSPRSLPFLISKCGFMQSTHRARPVNPGSCGKIFSQKTAKKFGSVAWQTGCQDLYTNQAEMLMKWRLQKVRKTVIFFTSSTPEVGPAAAGFALAAGMVSCCSSQTPKLLPFGFCLGATICRGRARCQPGELTMLTIKMIRVIIEI